MEEFHKTVRFSHRLLMTVSAALLLFAFSPNPTVRYEDALEELNGLRSAEMSDYTSHATTTYELRDQLATPSCGDNDPLAAEESAALRRVVGDEEGVFKRVVAVLPVPDRELSNLSDYMGFFDDSAVVTLCISRRQIAQTTKSALEEADFSEGFKEAKAAEIKLGFTEHSFDRANELGESIYMITFAQLGRLGYSPEGGRIDFLAFSDFLSNNPQFLSLAYRVDESAHASTYYNASLTEGTNIGMSPSNASAWFTKAEENTSFESALPKVFAVFDEVKDKTIDDAIRYLSRQIVKERAHPKIYGVEVDSTYAILVAPFVLLALQIFLTAHLLGLRTAIDQSGEVEAFPSILFYRGSIVSVLAPVTVALLPVVAAVALLFRLGGGVSWQMVIASAMIFATFSMSIAATLLCRSISRLPHQN